MTCTSQPRRCELSERQSMQLYDFEVLRGEEVVEAEISIPLHSTRAAWPRIVKIAKRMNEPGCRIRVREQFGQTIILVGVAAALRYASAMRAEDDNPA